jgi:protein TonB
MAGWHLRYMKRCIPLFWVLFFVISSASFTAKGQSTAPIKTNTVDSSSEDVDIFCFFPEVTDPDFPGGMGAWLAFIQKNLRYPRAALKANIQGTVVVQFTVNPNGKVTDIRAVSGPEELKQAAVDVINKSSKWNPAVQRGRNVKGYKKQPIIFRIEK